MASPRFSTAKSTRSSKRSSELKRRSGPALKPDPVEIDLLTGFVLGKSRAWLAAHRDLRLNPSQRRKFLRLAARRRQGVPIAYLTGQKEFFGRMFLVGPGVLIPRPETEQLVEAALSLIPNDRPMTIAEIGTGSGCIAVTLAAERPKIRVLAIDQSTNALNYARRNVKKHDIEARVGLIRGDLLTPLINKNPLPSLIVANLPYLKPTEIAAVRHEPRLALVGGRDGLKFFRQMFQQLKLMSYRGPVLLEIDPRRVRQVVKLARRGWPSSTIAIRSDLAGRARIVLIDASA